jgi:hypothetical protein
MNSLTTVVTFVVFAIIGGFYVFYMAFTDSGKKLMWRYNRQLHQYFKSEEQFADFIPLFGIFVLIFLTVGIFLVIRTLWM